MKKIIPLVLMIALSSAAMAARVKIMVIGSPCTGGPTNCAFLTAQGLIEIQKEGSDKRIVKVDKDGTTEVSLQPGRYVFHYVVHSPVGSSAPVEQDIVNLRAAKNAVVLNWDTGIR